MPETGLVAANVRKKSKRFTPYVRYPLTAALTFGFRLFALGGFRFSLRGRFGRLGRLRGRLAGLPACLVDLPSPSERERARRHIVGDHRAGADIRPVADLDRRDHRRIAADEGALADVRAVFGHTVVSAEDR